MMQHYCTKMEKLAKKELSFASIPQKKNKQIDYSLCILCQDPDSEPLHKLKTKTAERLRETLQDSSECYDLLKYEVSEPGFLLKNPTWHGAWRRKFMKSKSQTSVSDTGDDSFLSAKDQPILAKQTVTSMPVFSYTDSCLFCTKKGSAKKITMSLWPLETVQRCQNIMKQAHRLSVDERDLYLRCKDKDLVAVGAKYHAKCMNSFMKRTHMSKKKKKEPRPIFLLASFSVKETWEQGGLVKVCV